MAGGSRIPSRRRREIRQRRKARLLGLSGFVAAAALPIVLWRRAIALIASDFRLDLDYLVTGWTAYALIGAGLLCLLPVVLSIGRNPESRFYPRSRGAYMGWGVTLYVLGIALASQVAQIARGPSEL